MSLELTEETMMESPLRILHLEDDPKDAELIQAMLETAGIICHITRVETQADFLVLLEQGGFDLILADHTLPSFDGLSALKLTQEKCPDIPFIFVSGTLGEEVAIEALKIGATDYVLKERLSRIAPSVRRALREAKERTERKQLEAQLREGEERFRLLSESSLTGIYLIQEGRFRYVNPAMARLFGYTVEEVVDRLSPLDLVHPDDRHVVTENIRRRVEGEVEEIQYDFRGLRKDSSVISFEVHGRRIEYGGKIGVIGTLVDITDRKRAEEERQAHLWFLESLDQVNRAMQGTNDLEPMMSDVLDVVLTIFDCDRAWLLYPCDPEEASCSLVIERTRPEYPGALALGVKIPTEEEGARFLRAVLAASGPVRFGPGSEHPLPAEAAQRFRIQSMMAMAIYPKGG
jgi:PAS domain S-box-containing protein